MKIHFNKDDRQLVAKELETMGYSVTERRIDDVLYNVEAAFIQQLGDQAKYMIQEDLV